MAGARRRGIGGAGRDHRADQIHNGLPASGRGVRVNIRCDTPRAEELRGRHPTAAKTIGIFCFIRALSARSARAVTARGARSDMWFGSRRVERRRRRAGFDPVDRSIAMTTMIVNRSGNFPNGVVSMRDNQPVHLRVPESQVPTHAQSARAGSLTGYSTPVRVAVQTGSAHWKDLAERRPVELATTDDGREATETPGHDPRSGPAPAVSK